VQAKKSSFFLRLRISRMNLFYAIEQFFSGLHLAFHEHSAKLAGDRDTSYWEI